MSVNFSKRLIGDALALTGYSVAQPTMGAYNEGNGSIPWSMSMLLETVVGACSLKPGMYITRNRRLLLLTEVRTTLQLLNQLTIML